MRQSSEAKAHTHEVILHNAARLFREQGVAGTSVADVMQAAKLTVGGFYRHFESKDDLLAASIETAFNEMLAIFDSSLPSETPRASVDRYASMYLSDDHISSPGLGCPMASLGTEMSRAPQVATAATAEGMNRMLDAVAQRLGGPSQTSRERAAAMFATLIGAVVMARAAGEDPIGNEILEACRKRLGV